MLLLAAFTAACGGFALLALGQARHAGAVAGAPPRPRPLAAAALLGLSLGLAVLGEGWGFGILAWATLLTLAAVAVVAILAWRPRWLRPLLPRTSRSTHAMRRTILAAAFLFAAADARPAAAHMVWLEREGATVRLYFGEPDQNLRERTGATLDMIASPRLLGTSPPPTREPDHVAFGPVPEGDARAVEEGLAPRDDRQRGGRTRTVFLAREGRGETRGALELELVPVAAGGGVFTLLFRGEPLPRAGVELIGPPSWTKALRTDAEGRVTLPLPWAGRYIAEVQHVADGKGGEGERAHDRTRYVATLSFVAEQGIPWTGPRP